MIRIYTEEEFDSFFIEIIKSNENEIQNYKAKAKLEVLEQLLGMVKRVMANGSYSDEQKVIFVNNLIVELKNSLIDEECYNS